MLNYKMKPTGSCMMLISFPSKYHLMSSGFGTERASHSTVAFSPSEPNWVLFEMILGKPK